MYNVVSYYGGCRTNGHGSMMMMVFRYNWFHNIIPKVSCLYTCKCVFYSGISVAAILIGSYGTMPQSMVTRKMSMAIVAMKTPNS